MKLIFTHHVFVPVFFLPGGVGDAVTITGTRFSTTTTDNEVTIGGVACNVTAATATQLTCTLGAGEPGTRMVSVYVSGKGDATTQSDVTFFYEFNVDSVSPTSVYSSGKILN